MNQRPSQLRSTLSRSHAVTSRAARAAATDGSNVSAIYGLICRIRSLRLLFASWPGLASRVYPTCGLIGAELGRARVPMPSTPLPLNEERRGCPALRFTLGPAGGRTRVPGMTAWDLR